MMEMMTPLPFSQPREGTVEYLRERAREAVHRISLRAVARQIGMSPTGLKKFLAGTAPYSPTLRRLRKWYLLNAAVPTGQVTYEDASAAIAVLTLDFPGDPRREAAEHVLDCLARGYDATGREHPHWMAEIRDELAKAA